MLEAKDLSVRFPAGHALRGADLSLAPGERLGVVGESGSGKSMLGLALMGMTPAAARLSGTLRLDGRDMSRASERDWRAARALRIAMIFQEPMAALNPLRRVGVTVMEPLRVRLGLSRREAEARALRLFEEVDLPDPAARLRQYPHELSGGQRQRVLIALALACDPAILVADEPTTALDAEVALRIVELLSRLSRERGMALVFISHDLAAVARATDRLMVLYGGDVVERGETRAVLSDPRHPYTRGLIAARPRPQLQPRAPGAKRPRLRTIPGSVPPLAEAPAGCRFAGRCPVERPDCAAIRPAARPTPHGAVACHLAPEDGA